MNSFELYFVDVASFSTPNWLIIWGGILGTSNLLIKFVILFLITLEIKAIKTFPVVFVMTAGQLLSILRLTVEFWESNALVLHWLF